MRITIIADCDPEQPQTLIVFTLDRSMYVDKLGLFCA